MALVRFGWNPILVELRRQVCPNAHWQKRSRQWLMQDEEAEAFLQAAHSTLGYQKWQTRIVVDDDIWMVGFVRGAPPYRLTAAQSA